jgi:hypothetical protein
LSDEKRRELLVAQATQAFDAIRVGAREAHVIRRRTAATSIIDGWLSMRVESGRAAGLGIIVPSRLGVGSYMSNDLPGSGYPS